jgi:hypothetical protein
MNMSDDLSGAVVGISGQVTSKGIDKGLQVVDNVTDMIAKLLKTIYNFGKQKQKQQCEKYRYTRSQIGGKQR